MKIINYECKISVDDIAFYEQIIVSRAHRFVGTDEQIDTYFNAPKGRLKLREGDIENALIQYDRDDIMGAKLSKILLYKHNPDAALKQILTDQFGVNAIVKKQRKIYYIDNVKFHFDTVDGLGCFVEIEAIGNEMDSVDDLQRQCQFYLDLFRIEPNQFVAESYSDLIARRGEKKQQED